MRGGAAIAWQAYLVNLLFFLGVAQGALVASAAFYLTQAKWGGSTPYRLGEAFAPFLWVGFFLFFGLYFGRSLIFPVGDASDTAEGRMAEHSVSLCARRNRTWRDGRGELRVHPRFAPRRRARVDDRNRRHRVAAAFDPGARPNRRGPVRRGLHADLIRSGHVAGAGVAQHAFRLVFFRRRFLERIVPRWL